MTIAIHETPLGDDKYTRYLLVYPDAPTVVEVHKLFDHSGDGDLTTALLIMPDGTNAPIVVEQDNNNPDIWRVFLADPDAVGVVEEVVYEDDESTVRQHHRFVDGFTTNDVPTFG